MKFATSYRVQFVFFNICALSAFVLCGAEYAETPEHKVLFGDPCQHIFALGTEENNRLLGSTCTYLNDKRRECESLYVPYIRNLFENKTTFVKNFAYKILEFDQIEEEGTTEKTRYLALGDLRIITLKPLPGGKKFGTYIIWHGMAEKRLRPIRHSEPIILELTHAHRHLSDLLVSAVIPDDLQKTFEKSSELYYKKFERAKSGDTYGDNQQRIPITCFDEKGTEYFISAYNALFRHKILFIKQEIDRNDPFCFFGEPGEVLIKPSLMLFNGRKEIAVIKLPHLNYLASTQQKNATHQLVHDGTYELSSMWKENGIIREDYVDKITVAFDIPGNGYSLTAYRKLLLLANEKIPFAQIPESLQKECEHNCVIQYKPTAVAEDQYHNKEEDIYVFKRNSLWHAPRAQQCLLQFMLLKYNSKDDNKDLAGYCTAALLSNFNVINNKELLTDLLVHHLQNMVVMKNVLNPFIRATNVLLRKPSHQISNENWNRESHYRKLCSKITTSLIPQLNIALANATSFDDATEIVKSKTWVALPWI